MKNIVIVGHIVLIFNAMCPTVAMCFINVFLLKYFLLLPLYKIVMNIMLHLGVFSYLIFATLPHAT